ncbi:MAG TPA: hypothetical protein VFK34_00570 [Marmoricola sp.]|jgi:hypothetical protein|nr:hypothetical protein [Marmoricola sp.]
MSTLVTLAAWTFFSVVSWADQVPEDKDVKAGWGAFFIFLGLALAVALLGWSLVRQLRRTKANADAGVFGPEDMSRDVSQGPSADDVPGEGR